MDIPLHVICRERQGSRLDVTRVILVPQVELHDGLLADEGGVADGEGACAFVYPGNVHLGRCVVAVGSDVFQRSILIGITRATELERKLVTFGEFPGNCALQRSAGTSALGGECAYLLALIYVHLFTLFPGGGEYVSFQVKRLSLRLSLLGIDDYRVSLALNGFFRGLDRCDLHFKFLGTGERSQHDDCRGNAK